ncbi:hypothetical protein KFK09_003457 [Dendrobium nobile]|uniref:Uncharacterized protein n=1 Tax=Dendrobium nobile TaxID=94219 RepID=A0A8T3C089_DENNO|nr:hypothetical protein KFK09_003457 [Dendrobium nobile]
MKDDLLLALTSITSEGIPISTNSLRVWGRTATNKCRRGKANPRQAMEIYWLKALPQAMEKQILLCSPPLAAAWDLKGSEESHLDGQENTHQRPGKTEVVLLLPLLVFGAFPTEPSGSVDKRRSFRCSRLGETE